MKKRKKKRSAGFRLLIGYSIFVIILFGLSVLFLMNEYGIIKITGFSVADTYDSYNIYVLNSYEGSDISFVVPVENKKDSVVNEAKAEITVLDPNGTEITKIESNKLSLQGKESNQLTAIWQNSSKSGEYQARVMLLFDDDSYSFSKIFNIEQKTLTFESIVVDQFNLGDIVNFSIVIQNHLGKEISNVSSGLLVYDDNNNIISQVRSEKTVLLPNQLNKLKVQWDTKNLNPGKYNAKLNIDYSDKFIDKDIVLNIYEDNMEVVGVGYSIARENPKSSFTTYLVIFLVVMLVLINLTWIILYRRKSKENLKK